MRWAVASAFDGVDPLLLAGSLFFAQPGSARIPIIDLAGQPGPHLALDLVDLSEPAPLHLGQVVRNEAGDGVSQCAILDPLRQPRRGDYLGDRRTLLRLDRPAIEIRSRAAVDRAAVLFQVYELQPLRNHPRLAGPAARPSRIACSR